LHPQHFARQRVEISGPEGVPLQLQPLVIAVHVSEPQMKGAAFSPTNPQPLLVPGPSTINAPQSNVGKAIAIVARPLQQEIQQPSEVKSAIVTPAAPPPRRFAVRQNTPVPLSAAEAFLERLEARSNGPLPPPPPPPKPTPLSPQELARQAATLDDLEKQLAELK
jgi:hypothetical protein